MSTNASDIETVLLSLRMDSKIKSDAEAILKKYRELQRVTAAIEKNMAGITGPKGTSYTTNKGVDGTAYGLANVRTQRLLKDEQKQLGTITKAFQTELSGVVNQIAKIGGPKAAAAAQALKNLNDGLATGTTKINAFARAKEKQAKAEDRAAVVDKGKARQAALTNNTANKSSGSPVADVASAKSFQQKTAVNREKAMLARNQDQGASLLRNQATLVRNYALIGGAVGAGYSTGNFIVELDKSLKQLQSIAALTNTEMAGLTKSIISVSEATKFTAVEVAAAATTMAQAGFGKDQIATSLESITLFATAVGTDLKNAVDLATSTLGVYNKSANQLPDVTDKMTVAINSSKLNLDKLSLGLQYAGNIAAQSNVSFEETVATLAAMANSGIRSGSTLGTGLRQILIALQKPSEGLTSTLANLGIGLDQIDLKTHGLIGVMTNLANGGFTVTDAMRTMEVRAGAAFSAFVNNIDVANDIAKKMEIGGAATKANAVQMEALSNQWAKFGSIAKSVAYEAFEPTLKLLTATLSVVGDLISKIKELGVGLPILGTLLSTYLGVRLFRNLNSLRKVFSTDSGIIARAKALATGAAVTSAGGSALGGASGGFLARMGTSGLVRGVIAVVASAGGWAAILVGAVATLGYSFFKNKFETAGADAAQGALSETFSARSRQEDLNKKLSATFIKIFERQPVLSGEAGSEELKKQIRAINSEFKEFGFYLNESTTSFEDLVAGLKKFRGLTNAEILRLSPKLVAQTEDLAKARTKQGFGRNDSYVDKFVAGTQKYQTYQTGQYSSSLNTQDFEFLNSIGSGGNSKKFQDLQAQVTAIDIKSPSAEGAYKSAEASYRQLYSEFKRIADSASVNEDQKELLAGALKKLDELIVVTQQGQISALDVRNNLPGPNGGPSLEQKRLETNTILETQFTSDLIQRNNEQTAKLQGLAQASANTSDPETSKVIYDQLLEFQKEADLYREKMKAEFELALSARDIKLKSTEGVGLSNTYLEPQLNALDAGIKALLDTVKPKAKVVLDAETEAQLKQLATKQKDLEAERGDTLNAEKVVKLTEEIATIIAQKYTLTLGQTLFSSDKGSETLITAESGYALANEQRANTRVGAQQGEYIGIYDRLLAGDFEGLTKDSKITDKELAKALRMFMKERMLEIDNAFSLAQSELISYDLEDLRLKQKVKVESRFTGDAGIVNSRRLTPLMNLGNTQSKISDNQIAKTQQEIKNLESQFAKQAKLQALLKQELTSLDGRSNSDVKTDLDKLTKEQLDVTQKIIDLNLRIDELGVEKANNTFDNNVEQIQLRRERSGFMSDDQLRAAAAVNGTGYQTASGSQVGPTSPNASGNLGQGVANGLNFSLGELEAYYEGYDGLGELFSSLTESAKTMGDSFGSAFASFVDGSTSASDAARNFLLGFLGDLASMAARVAANQLMSYILSAGFGLAGGTADGAGSPTIGPDGGGMRVYQGGLQIAGRYATGGLITAGRTQRDSSLAHVAKGEFVLRRAAVQALGVDTVRGLNSLDPNTNSLQQSMGSVNLGARGMDDSKKEVNVYVVNETSRPQAMGKSDILAVINDDVMRNGATKQLIKRVSMGDL